MLRKEWGREPGDGTTGVGLIFDVVIILTSDITFMSFRV